MVYICLYAQFSLSIEATRRFASDFLHTHIVQRQTDFVSGHEPYDAKADLWSAMISQVLVDPVSMDRKSTRRYLRVQTFVEFGLKTI